MANDPVPTCVICKGKADSESSLFEDGYYSNTFFHLACLNSEDAKKWRSVMREKDPKYASYSSLITAGLKLKCENCGSDENYLNPKFIGHSPYFEACCSECSEVSNGLNPYLYKDLIDRLLVLMERFKKGSDDPDLDGNINEIAKQGDGFLKPSNCKCGGKFSLKAKPRCKKCRHVIYESYFHYVE